jgi:hypothetical protein
MTTVQLIQHTDNSTYTNLLDKMVSVSDQILFEQKYDIPAKTCTRKAVAVEAMLELLCANMVCDYPITECIREKMNVLTQTR